MIKRSGIILFAVLTASFLIYFPLNHSTANNLNLHTPLDDLIPIIPIFVVPYLLHWVVLVGSLIYFFLKYRAVFNRVGVALILANLSAALIYTLAQTYINRPEITGTDVFSGLVRWLYSIDSPYSAWPSLHTACSIIYAWGWWKVSRNWGHYAWIFTALVIASTILIKQHYILDILGGVIFAYGAIRISKILNRR